MGCSSLNTSDLDYPEVLLDGKQNKNETKGKTSKVNDDNNNDKSGDESVSDDKQSNNSLGHKDRKKEGKKERKKNRKKSENDKKEKEHEEGEENINEDKNTNSEKRKTNRHKKDNKKVNKVKKEDKNKNNNKDDNKDIDNKDNNKNNVKNKGNNKENDNVKDNEKNNIIKKEESTDLEDLRESIEKERIELKKEKESFINKKKEFEKEKEKFKKEKEELEQKFNQKKIEPENETKKKAILVGLNNIGATCYMNATLQCLSNTKKLTEYFLNEYKSNKANILSYEYYKVLKNLWDENNHKNAYSPYSFKEVLSKENPLFSGIQANDSKDLLNFLVERFHQELNKTKPKNEENKINFNQVNQSDEMAMFNLFMAEFKLNFNSPISNLFYGLLETKSQCSNCKIIKFNFQIYSFLEFPLEQVNKFYFQNGRRPLVLTNGKNPDIDLYECFEYNRKLDNMSGDNQMYCNNCNKTCDSSYCSLIYSGSNYLIIYLNRGKAAVYECKVNFPELLNILNFVSYKEGITTYSLYGVICHLGPSSMSGHFVAYCRNRIDNKWYLYNDGIVTLCTRFQQYNEGMPYILFYRGLSADD